MTTTDLTSDPSIRVVLVEDDEDVREAVHDVLVDEGFGVEPFGNGLNALRSMRDSERSPDLILLDLNMVAMDGWQFRLEQRQDQRLAQIPVIVMSADGSPKARAIDADAFLQKPLDTEKLIRSIRDVVAEGARRRLEQAKGAFERMASLGTLAAGVAHEINNPLAFITANLRLLAEEIPRIVTDIDRLTAAATPKIGDLDPVLLGGPSSARVRLLECSTMVQESIEGATRIQNIVRDIRTFSHVDEAPRSAIDPMAALASAINLAGSEIRSRARLVRELGPVPKVLADEGKLGQVFLNLLVNAAQAMREGSGRENVVTVRSHTDAGGEAIIEISDTGEGIREENRSRIFEPFFTTKAVGAGVGLGLSICHGIITSLGGDITVDSDLGVGSTFIVRLPAAPRTSPLPPANPTPTPGHVSLPRARILVIDDEPALTRVLVRQLGKVHDVRAVTSGKDGLGVLLGGEEFDVILCDLLMPEVTGMDVHEQLAALRPGYESRIVFMTGGAFTPRARDFVARVSNRFLDKPLDMTALNDALAAQLIPGIALS